jgi:hypothetical protein
MAWIENASGDDPFLSEGAKIQLHCRVCAAGRHKLIITFCAPNSMGQYLWYLVQKSNPHLEYFKICLAHRQSFALAFLG